MRKKDAEIMKRLGKTLRVMYILMQASFEYGDRQQQENCINQFNNLKRTMKDLTRWYVQHRLVFRKPKYNGYIVIK